MQRMEKSIVYNLQVIGEKCLNAARSTDSYKDQTGNLRSSLGYVIVRDGVVLTKSNEHVYKQGSQGSKAGADYAKELAAKFPKGYVLIVVAGMHYAAYVSAKGYDVLDSAELVADREVSKLLGKLGITK
jgi:hypothetical protein